MWAGACQICCILIMPGQDAGVYIYMLQLATVKYAHNFHELTEGYRELTVGVSERRLQIFLP